MRRAMALAAQAAAEGDVPVGCVIVRDGQIVGEGRNRREEHGDATAHAELEAIRDACRVGELLELMGKPDARLIVNRVSRAMLSSVKLTVDDVMDSAGLPLLGIVLEDPNVILSAALGQPLLRYKKRSAAATAYCRIARRIQGIPEPITIR